MSYQQQPPADPYGDPRSRPSFTPYQQGQPSYGPPQGQQPGYQQPQQPYYGNGVVQPAQQPQPAPPDRRPYPPQVASPGHRAQRQAGGKQYALRGAEAFWYLLGCIAMGAAYFSKIPGKKAACEVFSELQADGQGPGQSYSLRGMEPFWYVMMCLAFGSGYFAKVSAKKALWELVGMVRSAPGEYGAAIGRALAGTGSAAPYGPGY